MNASTRFSYYAGLILCSLAICAYAGHATAGTIAGAYKLDISSSDKVLFTLGTPQELQAQHEASCDNPNLRILARNKPAVKVTNDGLSQGDISSLTIEISEPAFLFGEGDNAFDGFTGLTMISPYSDPMVDILGSSLSSNGRRLTIDFNGLEPGKSIIFRVDLDPLDESAFPFPDFRQVLYGYDANGTGGVGQRAETSAIFSSNGMSTPTEFTPLPEVDDPLLFLNEHVRPYQIHDPVIPYPGGGSTNPIPEPTSLVLLLAGLGLSGVRRRTR